MNDASIIFGNRDLGDKNTEDLSKKRVPCLSCDGTGDACFGCFGDCSICSCDSDENLCQECAGEGFVDED